MPKNILISTLGLSWEIIPETVGAFFYEEGGMDFYGNVPEESVQGFRESAKKVLQGQTIDELWLISTDQEKDPKDPRSMSLSEMRERIAEWCNSYAPANKLAVRIFVLKDVNDIDSKESVDKFHNLALQVLFTSKLYANGGKRIVSLACGRKTMSADIQDAAYCFGCDMMMHVTASANPTKITLDGSKNCLNEAEKKSIFPVELKPFPASDLFNDWYGGEAAKQYDMFAGNRFCEALDETTFLFENPEGVEPFLKKVEEKREAARHFYSSYWSSNQYSYDNFPIVYTLSSNAQQSLKDFKIGVHQYLRSKELELLKTLPKADLHCHLGGVLSPKEIIEVAGAIEDELHDECERNPRFKNWNMQGPNPSESWKGWRHRLAKKLNVSELSVVAAYVLQFKNAPEKLDEIIYGQERNGGKDLRVEQQFVGIAQMVKNGETVLDLTPYESLGDLQGSGLLKHEKTLRKVLQILYRNVQDNNLKYLEIRCSPINYKTDIFAPRDVVRTILDEMTRAEIKMGIRSSMIFIASRHGKLKDIDAAIELYRNLEQDIDCGEALKRYFRGFDVAGNESKRRPEKLRGKFQRILMDCKNVTVHAGETMPAENIWEAVYCLNAERIGHGLTLVERDGDLLPKFRDRRIGVEMCPSSNYQIVGFKDNYYPDQNLPDYPLRKYMDEKIRVTVNTDDPGMSRTNITNELLKAARLTRGGLSLWDILSLLYNSFEMAFLPYGEKMKLLNEMNLKVKDWLDANIVKIENGCIYEE